MIKINHEEFDAFIESLYTSGMYSFPKSYRHTKPAVFALESYKRWAIGELRDFVEQRIYSRPIDSVEAFRKRMDNYACMAKTEEAKYMFSTAYDVVTDILDMML